MAHPRHLLTFIVRLLLGLAAAHGARPATAAVLTLDNGTVKVGADTAFGGSITYLSPSSSATNLINSYDLGRQVQQSYYSGPADFHPVGTTQHPSWSPWPWNPIQTGDAYNHRATVLESSNSGGVIYIKTRPMQWALQNVPGDCTFEWWIRLEGVAARVRCRLTNARTDPVQYGARHQELPAVYGVGTLNRVFSYTGTVPFTNAALTQLPSVGPPWSQWRATENWSAIVNSADLGIGVHHPDAIYTTGGYASSGSPGTGGPSNFNTGYVAPIHSEVLDANLVYDYEFNLVVGTLTDIRTWVYAHADDHRPAWRFATDRRHWGSNLGDAGPPAGFLRQKLGADPQLVGPYCAFQSAAVSTVFFSARYNVTSPPGAPAAQLFWETGNSGGFAGARSVSVSVSPSAGWRIYALPVGGHANWTGMISQLRLDPIQSAAATDTVDVGGISWKNDAPVLSAMADVTSAHGSPAPTVSFSVSDDLVPDEALAVTATSSNQLLLPNSAIQIGGSGATRTLTLASAANQLGTATITVNVSDTALSASRTFLLTITGTALETWRFDNFGTTANSGNAADTANPDGDAWTNSAEYVLGTSPIAASPGTILTATRVPPNVTLSFVAAQAAGPGYSGLTRFYDVETKSDLTSPTAWAGVSGYTNIVGANQTIAVTQPLISAARFYRLKVRVQ